MHTVKRVDLNTWPGKWLFEKVKLLPQNCGSASADTNTWCFSLSFRPCPPLPPRNLPELSIPCFSLSVKKKKSVKTWRSAKYFWWLEDAWYSPGLQGPCPLSLDTAHIVWAPHLSQKLGFRSNMLESLAEIEVKLCLYLLLCRGLNYTFTEEIDCKD